MFQKIKELMAIKEEIDVIKNNLNYATNAVNGFKNELSEFKIALKSNIDNMSSMKGDMLNSLTNDIQDIKLLRLDFEKELYQFKLLKSQMQKKLIERFEEELNNELKINLESLKGSTEDYTRLKSDIGQISLKLNTLSEEMNKFISISGSIKKEDFELSRHASRIFEADREKLEMMRKIDVLERLVSKMRRNEIIR
jgi:AAA+ superfamily predicted ATPase